MGGVENVFLWIEANMLWTLVILGILFLIGLIRDSEFLLGTVIALTFVSAFIWGYGV